MEEPDWLEKARGYVDLGMLDEAQGLIKGLSDDEAASSAASEMLIVIAFNRKDYDDAFRLSKSLAETDPENHAGFLQGAYALHVLGRTEDAIEYLQQGPASLQDEQCYFYNLACYEVALGRTEAALTWLLRSIELDPRNRMRALNDKDLAPLHSQIPKQSRQR